jgi:hypothetical protein
MSRLSHTGVRLGQDAGTAEPYEKRLFRRGLNASGFGEAGATAWAFDLCESGFGAFPILSLAFCNPVTPSAAAPDFESVAPLSKVDCSDARLKKRITTKASR